MSKRGERRRAVAQALADVATAPERSDPVEAAEVAMAGLIRLAETSPLVLVLVLRRAGREARQLGLSPDLLHKS